jgi:hypothetical protein
LTRNCTTRFLPCKKNKPRYSHLQLARRWLNQDFKPRLAFNALQYFLVRLGDATFIKKWPSAKNTYILEFRNATQQILMAWTTKGESNELENFDSQKTYDRDGNNIKEKIISEAPIYLVRALL